MFNKSTFGVPQFYPRDLKKRVDEYVVGQERAKKTISSVIFNHYQGVRRRHHQDESKRKREERLSRRHEARERLAREREPMHPVEGSHNDHLHRQRYCVDGIVEDEFPGHNESVLHSHSYPQSSYSDPSEWHEKEQDVDFYVPEETGQQPIKIDKSNLLLIGPTGVGKTYILE
jgi:ATP-dependent Clp protease ATP-binding subunit ClpX